MQRMLLKRGVLIFGAFLLFGFGCNTTPKVVDTPMSERVSFQSSDGVTIVGDYYAGPIGSPVVILLHMRPAVRGSWQPFAEKLVAAGFSSLAIDLRGHGESIRTGDGRLLDYNRFSESEEKQSIKDVEAAAAWLKNEKGVTDSQIFLAGASIGANLALQYFAKLQNSPAAILLSPGINYRGVETLPAAQKLKPTQAVFIAAAKDDPRSGGPADVMAQQIHDAAVGKKTLKLYETGGHGTDLFVAHPDLMDELIRWLNEL